ncbi:MAG: 50S ribosomal protein L15 [Micrococcales bacterium]|nr:50S ribosomal protein L15 [Micrococcales bacterium]MCL2668089.1 50S ribosomal protein L15 [Micrococcales bacterium]
MADEATPEEAKAEAKPKAKAAPKAKAETKAAAAPKAEAKADAEAKAPAKPKAAKPKAEPKDEPAAEAPKRTRKPAAKADAKEKADKPAASEGHGGTLRVHHLRPAPGAHKRKIRVGRGEGSKGKTAGRGTKGTKARYQVPARFEGGQTPLHMRLPKLRGFRNPFRVEYQVVNLDKLTMLYPDGGTVTPADLVAKGAVRKGWPVKVLGDGEVTVKLTVDVDALSASARDKILAAGGSVANG